MKNLRYNLQGTHMHDNTACPPQDKMKELGITYKKAVPQSICDQWWFLGCDNIPKELPEYITILDADVSDFPECK